MVPFERGVPLVPSVSPGHLSNINMIQLAPPQKNIITRRTSDLCDVNSAVRETRCRVLTYARDVLHTRPAAMTTVNFVVLVPSKCM